MLFAYCLQDYNNPRPVLGICQHLVVVLVQDWKHVLFDCPIVLKDKLKQASMLLSPNVSPLSLISFALGKLSFCLKATSSLLAPYLATMICWNQSKSVFNFEKLERYTWSPWLWSHSLDLPLVYRPLSFFPCARFLSTDLYTKIIDVSFVTNLIF